jgi:V8-like Glu-specific endopeptidase
MKNTTKVLLVLLGLAGCGEMPDDVETTTDPVTGGQLVPDNGDPYGSVFRIATSDGGCTATKIGDRRFISAAHCFDGVSAGAGISMTNAINGSGGTTFTINTLDIHPSYVLNKGWYYDAAIFTINGPTSPPALTIRTSYVANNQLGILIGYGCDNTSTRDGQKQWAFYRAAANSNADKFTHFVTNVSTTVASCAGDSGGPYLIRTGVNTGPWEIAGIDKRHDGEITPIPITSSTSLVSRTGNIRGWIAAPGSNSFSNGSVGTFLNGDSGKCLGVDGSSISSGAHVSAFYCDGRQYPNDNQYWRLQSIGTSGFFLFVNTKSGLCLGVDGASTADGARVSQFGCDPTPTTTENQAWRFTFTRSVGNTNYYQIRNGKSGKCIGINGGSNANGAFASQFTCGATGINNQSYLFSR